MDNPKCDHCYRLIPEYPSNGYLWWCARCINEHGSIMKEFGLWNPGKTSTALHWSCSGDALRLIPKYDNIVL